MRTATLIILFGGILAAPAMAQDSPDSVANLSLALWSDCMENVVIAQRATSSDTALADRALNDCAAAEAKMNSIFAATYPKLFATPQQRAAHESKSRADWRSLLITSTIPEMRSDPEGFAEDRASERAKAWGFCLQRFTMKGLVTQGDLAALTDDALTARWKAANVTCAAQEASLAAIIAAFDSRSAVLPKIRASFYEQVLTAWGNSRDEVRKDRRR